MPLRMMEISLQIATVVILHYYKNFMHKITLKSSFFKKIYHNDRHQQPSGQYFVQL